MNNRVFLMLAIFCISSFNVLAQDQTEENSDIIVIPKDGKLIFSYDGEQLKALKDLTNLLEKSMNEEVVNHVQSFKTQGVISSIFWGLGGGSFGIWALSEIVNPDFHNNSSEESTWRYVTIGSTFVFSIIGGVIGSEASKQLIYGIEKFNDQN